MAHLFDPPRGELCLWRRWILGLLLLSGLWLPAGAQFQPSSAPRPSPLEQRRHREQWFLHGRITRGQRAAALRLRAHQQKLHLRSAPALSGQQKTPLQLPTSGWTPLGPAPLSSDASGTGVQDYNWVSGRVTAVAIDPADASANTVYIGGAYGGVWKSTNGRALDPGSVTWTPLTDDEPTLAVGALAVQPQLNNPDPTKSVILVGTGEANSSSDSYYGLGILRSADAGQTWTLISSDATGTRPFAGMAFSKIAFSTSNPGLVVAATAGASEGILEGLGSSTTSLGLYYSADGGLSWNYANVQDGTALTSSASATTVAYHAIAGQFVAALRYHGFYSSADGIHWTRLLNQPGVGLTTAACPAQSGNSGCPIYRGEIAVVPGRNEMYAWYVDVNDNDQGIWKTVDGGGSWIQLNEAGITNCGDPLGCGAEDGTYNLELAAVPDGGATDLYAGAVNLYKCQITTAVPDCGGSGANSFLNLTHAYGCSSIARVHPAQHAVSFLVINNGTQDVMYFANDGGAYRTQDGFVDLDTGTCGGSNQFDSLNQTLGSLSQLVSFAQATTDANTILGGAQGNGSPATQSALADSTWRNTDAGDGGFNAINPLNEDDWFVSNPPDASSGVNIFRCLSGINCHTEDFQNDQVVSSNSVGGDAGPYYPPFLLDPQNSAEMIVGTCRLWRGSSAGTGFVSLTNDFETGGGGICTGAETNLVSSLAAGGPVDASGFSNVIYAGTDGFGPLIPTIPGGGHIWVSTNVTGGASTWKDQTAGINPDSFPISSVAIDSSDPSGLTAYLSIMGFGVPHVWKTSDGGASWTDFSGNLPDNPANTILVDPGTNPLTGVVYVGTDVGVFSSSTASPNWAEVGPAPESGQSGYLPDVAVTALRMFNTGQDKFLRASTYGRGLWQFPLITNPDFLLYISNTPQTVFAGSSAVFEGTAFSLDGYNSPIHLTCAGSAIPPTCSISPQTVTPTTAGAAFAITASGPDGGYVFSVQGVGTDPGSITHSTSLSLNVVDFSLSAPSPGSITMAPGASSAAVTLQISAAGPFNQSVTLSCAGLPAGTACNFAPSSVVQPTAGSPVTATLSFTTAADTAAGTFSITISASTGNGPTKTETVSLTVIQDYSITIGNSALTATENTSVAFQGTLASLNGYNSPVRLSCGAGAPPICSVAPATLTPTPSGVSFTVLVSSSQCGQYGFDIVATGTDPAATSHNFPVTFVSTSLAPPDFTLEITNPSLSAATNTSATFQGSLSASACYTSVVNLSCGSGAPPTCRPSPPSLTPTITGVPFSVSVSSNRAQTYNFAIAATGTDPAPVQHQFLVYFVSLAASGVQFHLSLTNTTGPVSVASGETATYTLQLAPSTATFPGTVTLAYSSCPPLSTCSFSPSTIDAGKSSTTVKFSVQTTAAVIAQEQPGNLGTYPLFAMGMLLPGVLCIVVRRDSIRHSLLVLLVSMLSIAGLIACGGSLQGGSSASANPGTPAGTYNITVTATMNSSSGSYTATAPAILTVH